MSQSARLTSLQALLDWKASLCTFTAEAKEALSSVEMEIQRMMAWLDDQQKFWKAAVRKCEDEVFQAKNELAQRKMMRIGDRRADCTEQEKALRRARERLAHAEDKVERTRHWILELPDAINEYEGQGRQLAGMLEADMPRADALLEWKISSLETYLQVTSGADAPPSVRAVSPAPETPPQGEKP